jgi:hypothetical protein
MNKQSNLSAVVINNFGQLVRQSTIDAIEYHKELVKSIMLARHKLATEYDRVRYGFDKAAFDKICDMEIDELERLKMEYDEQVNRYLDKYGKAI